MESDDEENVVLKRKERPQKVDDKIDFKTKMASRNEFWSWPTI